MNHRCTATDAFKSAVSARFGASRDQNVEHTKSSGNAILAMVRFEERKEENGASSSPSNIDFVLSGARSSRKIERHVSTANDYRRIAKVN